MTDRLRITDKAGNVHFVVSNEPGVRAVAECGREFKLGFGGSRVWEIRPGMKHPLCTACTITRLKSEGVSPYVAN